MMIGSAAMSRAVAVRRKGVAKVENVRFLILGVGGMGQYHISCLKQAPEARVAGLVDPSDAAIEAARQRFPELAEVPAWSDYRTALREVQADAAIIVTPHSQHFEHGVACLDAG